MNLPNKVRRVRRGGMHMMAAAIACGVVVGLTASPASAASPLNHTEPPPHPNKGGQSQVEVDGRAVAAADDPVSITLPGAKTGDEVDLSLVPADEFKGEGDPALSTTVAGSTISTYGTTEGTQTLIEIPSRESPSEYRFPLGIPEGGEAVVLDDGSVALFAANGDPLGGFHTPWAYDANGKELATSFRLEGDTLVQTVDLSAASAFPVVADPDRGTEWWGSWTRFTRSETKSIASSLKTSSASLAKDFLTAAWAIAPGGARGLWGRDNNAK